MQINPLGKGEVLFHCKFREPSWRQKAFPAWAGLLILLSQNNLFAKVAHLGAAYLGHLQVLMLY